MRLQLIKLLQNIHKQFKESFRESLPKLAHMISKALLDNFPEVKKVIKIDKTLGKCHISIKYCE